MTTNESLRALMTRHNLTRADVARLLGMQVKRYSSGTVDSWLSGRRNCPPAKLELLNLKLEKQKRTASTNGKSSLSTASPDTRPANASAATPPTHWQSKPPSASGMTSPPFRKLLATRSACPVPARPRF